MPADDEIMIEVFGCTDTGRTRAHNEDSFVVFSRESGAHSSFGDVMVLRSQPAGILMMVADGMGGAAAGEVASAMAVDAVVNSLKEHWEIASRSSVDTRYFADTLRRATEIANARIHQHAVENPEQQGMGTTATIAAALGGTLFVSQVGDSRAYLVRDAVAHQITRDQSLMQRLVEAGELTREEAETSDRRNIILQALGPEASVLTDISTQELRDGDLLLLCSDGLSGQMREPEIAELVTRHHNLKELCEALVNLANERGGPDNITVVAARFSGASLGSPAAGDAVGYTPMRRNSGDHSIFTLDELLHRPMEEAVAAGNRRVGADGDSSAAPPADGSRDGEAGEDLHPLIIYGVLAAAVAGIVLILYRRTL